MQKISFSQAQAEPIRQFDSRQAASLPLGSGQGVSHVYTVFFAEAGEIGLHPAGFDQLFLVIQGQGWACGADGLRLSLAAGEGVLIQRGEMHAKGGEAMTALMLQIEQFELRPERLVPSD